MKKTCCIIATLLLMSALVVGCGGEDTPQTSPNPTAVTTPLPSPSLPPDAIPDGGPVDQDPGTKVNPPEGPQGTQMPEDYTNGTSPVEGNDVPSSPTSNP